MNPLRWSLGGLMLLMMAIAIGLAALRYPSPLVTSLVLSGTMILFCAAFIASIHATRSWRILASGFAIAGGISFLAHFAPFQNGRLGDQLITTMFLDYIYQWSGAGALPTKPNPNITFHMPSLWESWTTVNRMSFNQNRVIGGVALFTPEPFLEAGYCLWSLLAGYAGGVFALWLRRHRPEV
jgi:hypothetical protein